MRTWTAVACLLVAGAAFAHGPAKGPVRAPAPGALDFEPAPAGSYALPPLGDAADGAVLDVESGPTTLHELYAGKVVVLSFIYASCADADGCPLSMAVMRQVAADLEPEARLVTLSFDPARDTPESFGDWAARIRNVDADWRFVTTRSTGELEPILDAYDQAVQVEYDAQGVPTGQLAHVVRVYLVDREGRLRNVYSSSFLHAAVIANDVQTLLLEAGSGAGAVAARPVPVDLLALAQRPPLGLPPVPSEGLTPEKIALGRKLFFDRRLSLNGTMSCAMCHIPEQGFTNYELATAVGIEGRTVRRNAPTVLNVGYVKRLFHDGREGRLEQQIWGPLLARNEMGNPSVGAVIGKLETLPDYRGRFEAAFDGRGPGMETLGSALASYQRTLLAGDSPFDRWYFSGRDEAMSDAAKRGFELFSGEARCAACHPVSRERALFSDDGMHNTGVGYRASMEDPPPAQRVRIAPGQHVNVDQAIIASVAEAPPGDLGLYEITLDPDDRWRYRTPGLRNVALTPPYMHDGSLPTLRSVVEFYRRGGVSNETLDPLIAPLELDDAQVADLVAFLESLTSTGVEPLVLDARAAPIGDPE
jgi:cytochrome c peroxidase